MRQQHCIDTIVPGPGLPVERSLGQLWLGWLVSRLRRMPEQLLVWLERSRQRRDLAAMDDRILRDVGISRASAWSESRKWFWQP